MSNVDPTILGEAEQILPVEKLLLLQSNSELSDLDLSRELGEKALVVVAVALASRNWAQLGDSELAKNLEKIFVHVKQHAPRLLESKRIQAMAKEFLENIQAPDAAAKEDSGTLEETLDPHGPVDYLDSVKAFNLFLEHEDGLLPVTRMKLVGSDGDILGDFQLSLDDVAFITCAFVGSLNRLLLKAQHLNSKGLLVPGVLEDLDEYVTKMEAEIAVLKKALASS